MNIPNPKNNVNPSPNIPNQILLKKDKKSKFFEGEKYLWQLYFQPLFLSSWLFLIVLSYFFLDQPLAIFIHHHNNLHVQEIGHYVTMLGTGKVNFLIAAILLMLGLMLQSPKIKYFALFLIIALTITGISCDILKIFLGRARPTQFFLHGYYGFYFWQFKGSMWSLPSGHTAIITTTMTAISLQWPKYSKLCFLIFLAVGISRIVLEHHYLSDVLAAALLSSYLTIFIYKFLNHYSSWHQNLQNNSPGQLL